MTVSPVRRPGCAALAVVVRERQVLLVRRANPPDAGLWGFPGGRIEWGETAGAAAQRELAEETGVAAMPGTLLPIIEALDAAPDGEILHHYLMVPVLCHWQSGDGVAADDALEVGWFSCADLAAAGSRLSACVEEVARHALEATEDQAAATRSSVR